MRKFKIFMILIISLLLSLFINCALPGGVKAEETKDTNFSNAKIEITTHETSDYFTGFKITISDVPSPKDGHSFILSIGNTSEAPSECPDPNALLTYDQASKTYTATTGNDLTKAFTYKDNKYLYVYEKYYDNDIRELVEKVVLDKTEILKPEKKIYSDAYASTSKFWSTNITICYHIPVTENRNANIKIGKITDQQLLKDIKDSKAESFANLLNYAKQNNTPIYNEKCVLDANGRYSTLSQTTKKLLNIDLLEDGAYYYVYTFFDDENGKYDEQYAVTFTQANVDVEFNDFKLNLFGSSDFKWIDFPDINKNDEPVPTNEDPKQDTPSTEGTDFTDFSNAKVETIETLSFGTTGYILHIKNAEKEKKSHTYRYLISDGTNTPEYSDKYNLLKYDSESSIYELMDSTEIRDVLQLSRKSYIYVFENYFDETLKKTVTKLILDKTEIPKITTRLYSDTYSSLSMITNSRVQLIYNKPVTKDRRFTLKIGKITNNQILQDIKDNKLDGFANLLKFAKNDSSYSFLKTEILNVKAEYTNDDTDYLDINKLENNAYYYVYTLFDDENGKYEKEEAVTLTQASVYPQFKSYYLFLYGSDDFKWTEFNTVKPTVDNTTSPIKIPQTGQNSTVLAIIFIFSLIALFGYKYLRKTKGI